MTEKEALAEARRRWGEDAQVRHHPTPIRWQSRSHAVGRQQRGLFIAYGEGDSWEEAFKDADRMPGSSPGSLFPAPRFPDPS
jgi:hypothetical protein